MTRKLFLAYMLIRLIVFSTVELASTEECSDGWTPYENKCYRHSQDKKSWHDALGMCEREGGTLAAVTNQNINHNLWSGRGRDYWIGLTSTEDKNDWYWSGGTNFVEGNFEWATGEPTGGTTCARIKQNDHLADKECHAEYRYICQTETFHDSLVYGGGFWFYISENKANQCDASRFCFERGGYLAKEEVFNILEERVSSRQYWVGLSRRYWTDGSPYMWHNFKVGEYEDGIDNCYMLHLSENKWVRDGCNDKNFYICQKAKRPNTSLSTTTSTSTIQMTPLPTEKPSTTIVTTKNTTETISDVAVPLTVTASSAVPSTTLLYIFIIIWVLIAVLLIIVIVLAVILRRRINTKHSKDRLSMEEDIQQMSECHGTNSPVYSEQTRKGTNSARQRDNASNCQTTATFSDSVPIYAVPNKKKLSTNKI